MQNQTTVPQHLHVESQPGQQFHQQIQQWISSNPKIAPYKAEEALARLWVDQQDIFRQWEEQQQQANGAPVTPPEILLTTDSVNLVLKAWCHSNNGDVAAERAERLLHWMEDLHSSEQPDARSAFLPKPNYQSYATAIDAWSRAAVYESNQPSSGSNEKATKSGGRSKQVVSDVTKTGFECARRAEDLLMHMQRMHDERLQLAEDNGKSGQYNSEIQPDTRLFNLVLKSWCTMRGGTKASAIRAMRILDLMQELHHFQSKNAPEWQGVGFSKVQPNMQTYKLILMGWADATHTVEGPDRAEEILRHLLSMSKAGNLGVEIRPDAECFHIVMRAHAESVRKKRKGQDGSISVEHAQKATSLLEWMELLALRRITSKVQPTTESYRIALSAWVWGHDIAAQKEAEGILYKMIRAHDVTSRGDGDKSDPNSCTVQPETRDFNTLINCCSFARRVGADTSEEDDAEILFQRQLELREVFDIADGAFKTLLSLPYVQPDSATFAGIIRACVTLLPNTDERDERVIEFFRLAYRTTPAATTGKISSTSSERMRAPPGAGCVDANVLRQLRIALPSTEVYIQVREEFEKHRRENVVEE